MYATFAEVKSALSGGKTVTDILENYLQKIEERASINAFIEVFEDSAREQALRVDEKIKTGTAGKLAGMVIGLKDNLCYKGHKVTASSKILEGFESLFTATSVQRLLDEDAIIIGRLNCDEFAMGSSNETSFYGPVKNPLNENLVPGGSSGGTAAAVAAGCCTVALGSDTGGSIRQPASFTGTVGLKPTYGRISRYGLIAYASSFDQIGPITNNVQDAALLLEVMAGKDEYDNTVSSRPVAEYSKTEKPDTLKIAVLKESLEMEGVSPAVLEQTKAIIEKLKSEGHSIEYVSFPYLKYMVPAYYVLSTAEASSNLSRFDGVHYGYRSPEVVGVEATYVNSRSEGFGKEVKRRIMAGTFVLSNEFYDSYYSKAQKVRRILRDKTDEIMKNHDFLVLPTTPDVAFEINGVKDPIQMYLQDIFTVHANLTGNPAISLPLGKNQEGLPFGFQVMANHFEEKGLFDFSKYLTSLV
jgi:aspartyl-tRNA(Asn)/glutamyl-tRNA(Gln) amidotransferase subunit A